MAQFQGHHIRVTNSWFGDVKLYIDSLCRDSNKDLYAVSGKQALLSARLDPSNLESPLVEVFFKAIVFVRAKIHVNGVQVAGDVF